MAEDHKTLYQDIVEWCRAKGKLNDVKSWERFARRKWRKSYASQFMFRDGSCSTPKLNYSPNPTWENKRALEVFTATYSFPLKNSFHNEQLHLTGYVYLDSNDRVIFAYNATSAALIKSVITNKQLAQRIREYLGE